MEVRTPEVMKNLVLIILGYYVPYIADAFIKADDSEFYNLAGIAINDPIIGDGDLQQEGILSTFRSSSFADRF